jgi:hypothetical protein
MNLPVSNGRLQRLAPVNAVWAALASKACSASHR